MPVTKLTSGLPSRTMPQTVFDAASEKLMSELPSWAVEVSALEVNVNAKEVLVTAAAGVVTTKAADAIAAADVASDAAAVAQAAANTSVNAAAGFLATSATPLSTGTGLKTYQIQPNKSFFPGMFVIAVSSSNSVAYITGQVNGYNDSTGILSINGQAAGSPGTNITDWIIGPSGAQGVAGPVGSLAGANLTGLLNMARAPDLASASTIDPWSGAGNFMLLTGDNPITNFGPATQAGASRDLLATGISSLLAGPNIRIQGVKFGRFLPLSPGDRLELIAETTTITRVTVTRADGSSPSDRSRMHSVMLSF